MFTVSSHLLCLQQISKEKLEFTLNLTLFCKSSTFLTAFWLSIFMLSQPSRTTLLVDRSAPPFQSCVGDLK